MAGEGRRDRHAGVTLPAYSPRRHGPERWKMDTDSVRRATCSAVDPYAQANAAWQHALAQYLRLAREEVSAAQLRVAAAAVHAAALRKGRLAPDKE